MGHHLFTKEGKSLAMYDFDVALVKHLLMEGSRRIGKEDLARRICRWEYQGPGVWIGVDGAALSDESQVFDAAVEVARGLGDSIPVDYLNKHASLCGGGWHAEQRTADVAKRLRELQNHLAHAA